MAVYTEAGAFDLQYVRYRPMPRNYVYCKDELDLMAIAEDICLHPNGVTFWEMAVRVKGDGNLMQKLVALVHRVGYTKRAWEVKDIALRHDASSLKMCVNVLGCTLLELYNRGIDLHLAPESLYTVLNMMSQEEVEETLHVILITGTALHQNTIGWLIDRSTNRSEQLLAAIKGSNYNSIRQVISLGCVHITQDHVDAAMQTRNPRIMNIIQRCPT